MPRAETPRLNSEINVTPLVDVVLVLLIIFMVVTPMLRDEGEVQPPKTDYPPAASRESVHIALNMALDGTIRIGGETVSRDRLLAKLRETAGPGSESDILIKADAGLPFGAVRGLMSAVNRAGFNHVGLVTDQRIEM